MMWIAVALVISTQQPVYEDRAQAVVVNFTQVSASEVQFTSQMPAGWSFNVQLDGNQDGRWGDGNGEPKSDAPTADRSFGLHADGKTYCFQHILTALPEDPSRIFASSRCNRYRSEGSVEFGSLDDQSRKTITIKLPAEELFGTFPTARIRICVWDTKQMTCQYTLADPFVLART